MQSRQGVRSGTFIPLTVLAVAIGALAACTRESAPRAAGERVRVVATIGMIADVAARVGGPHVTVEALMGPGVDPHLYKASAGDVRRLARADLVLYNGLHLDWRRCRLAQSVCCWRIRVGLGDADLRRPAGEELRAFAAG
jgi:manganese/zinc/iron transport system substrate-binding protein